MSYRILVLHCVIGSSIGVDDMARPHLWRLVVHVQVRLGPKATVPYFFRLV